MIKFVLDLLERPLKNGWVVNNHYQLNRFIGRGSYGLAYEAIDLQHNKTVVVKQLRKRKRKTGKGFLEREAKMLSALNHPAIPKCLDVIHEDGKSFLVMEWVRGKNVEELIFYEGRKYTEVECFQILLKVLEIVQYIHDKGVVHRDLRLPNILLNNGKIFIIDFGLALFCDETDEVYIEAMPPEKRLYREISFASDFYALGHFVLFLLYSNYQSSSRKQGSWEEELKIGYQAKRIIRKLLKLDPCYESVTDIIEDIEELLKKTCSV